MLYILSFILINSLSYANSKRFLINSSPLVLENLFAAILKVAIQFFLINKKQIEVWDYGTGKKIKDVNIQYPANYTGAPMLVNAVKIARNGLDIAAGGSGYNAVEMFDGARGHYFGESAQINGAVTAVAVSPFGSGFVAGTENGEIICQMVRLKPA